MPVDPTTTDAWPCRTPEDVVLARTWSRTRALRRRKTLPAAGLMATVALAAVLVLPRSASPMRVAAEGGGVSAAEQSGEAAGSSEGAPAATTTTSAPPTGRSAPAEPQAPAPPAHVVAPVVGPVPVFPKEPVYSTSHPVLVDPEGDAWVQAEPARAQSDPALDITHMDVTANTTTVTTELRILDLAAAPFTSSHYGRPTSVRYVTTLQRPEGYFSFYVTRHLHDGSLTAEGVYWKADADTGTGTGSYGGTAVSGVTASVDATSGTVRVTVGFADLNQVLAAKGHQAMGVGTTVVPQGRVAATYATVQNMESAPDTVAHRDPAFSYRLGD